jgi:hypothetical protein
VREALRPVDVGVRIAPVGPDGGGDADREHHGDHGEARARPDLVHVLEQQLRADEREHHRDRRVGVAEAPDQALDEDEQRP